MSARHLLLCALALTGCAAHAPPPAELEAARAAYWAQPYDPAAINRLALAWVERGDVATARLLLYRAVRIAPDREDIRANLLRLEAGARTLAHDAQPERQAAEAVPPWNDGAPPPWPLSTPPALERH